MVSVDKKYRGTHENLLNLILSAIIVSLKTLDIVDNLPAIDFDS